jgi:hypothetical protein
MLIAAYLLLMFAFSGVERAVAANSATPPTVQTNRATSLLPCTSANPTDQTLNYDNCFGVYVGEDGSRYDGEFKDDNFNGHGTLTFTDGTKYVGEFSDGKFSGQGTYTWPSGDEYVGHWKDGRESGHGTLVWKDGSKYVGEFENKEFSGQGVIFDARGSVVEQGVYKHGVISSIDGDASNSVLQIGSSLLNQNSPNFELCWMALNSSNTSTWSSDTKSVTEAQRRGLSLDDCRVAIGLSRLINQSVPQQNSTDNKALCYAALSSSNTSTWSSDTELVMECPSSDNLRQLGA